MTKFIVRILIYAGIVMAVMAGNYLFNKNYMNRPPVLEEARVIIAGDSRIMTSIDPEKIDSSVNIAQNSESYVITYHKLKLILENNDNVEQILLGFSYPSFSAYLDGIFEDDIATADVLTRIYPLMSLEDFTVLEVDEEKYYQVLFKNLFVYPHINHQKYMGGFSRLEYGLDKADLESVILRHYYDEDTNNIGISPVAEKYLDSIILLAEEEEVELILVNVPLQEDYLEQIPENFREYYEEVKQECISEGVEVLDYGDLPMEDRYFKDYNHLDYEGATYFTSIIKQELEK